MNINRILPGKIKNVLLFLSVILLARSIGMHLSGANTLGSILRRVIIPSFPYLFLTFLIAITDFSNLRIKNLFSYFIPEINFPFSHWILIFGTGLISGILIYYYSYLGITVIFLILFMLLLFFAAIYASFTYGTVYGLIIFLISSPILVFLQKKIGSITMPSFLLSIPLTPMLIFVLALFFVYVLTNLFQNKKIYNSPLNWPIFLFLASVMFTTLISSEDLIRSYNGIFQEIIIPLTFFFLTITSVHNKEDIERLLLSIFISIMGTCFISFYFYAWFNPIDIETARGEIPEIIGGTQRAYFLPLLIGFPISLALIDVFKTKLKRIFAILGTIFLAIFTVILQSITLFYSITIGSSLVIKGSRYRKKYVFLIILMLIFMTATSFGRGILNIRFKDVDLSDYKATGYHFLEQRINGGEGAINHIKDYPFFGAGYGMYNTTRKHLYSKPTTYMYKDGYGSRYLRIQYMQAHSLYLENAADCGLIGLSALLFLIGSILKLSIKAVRESRDGNEKIISGSILGSIIGFFIMSLTSPTNFGVGSNFIWGAMLWTLIGLICVIRRLQIERTG